MRVLKLTGQLKDQLKDFLLLNDIYKNIDGIQGSSTLDKFGGAEIIIKTKYDYLTEGDEELIFKITATENSSYYQSLEKFWLDIDENEITENILIKDISLKPTPNLDNQKSPTNEGEDFEVKFNFGSNDIGKIFYWHLMIIWITQ